MAGLQNVGSVAAPPFANTMIRTAFPYVANMVIYSVSMGCLTKRRVGGRNVIRLTFPYCKHGDNMFLFIESMDGIERTVHVSISSHGSPKFTLLGGLPANSSV